jgi:hypothetical protein
MQVTKETLSEMRRTLELDRELCGNSPLAQKYLNECENIQNSLALDLAEDLVGTDTADSAELKSMVADLNRWQEDFYAIPVQEHGSESYQAAEAFLRILKLNYVKLYQKNRIADLLSTEPLQNAVKE